MKRKNPLYVVKGKDILEANSLFDLIMKKFNLAPILRIFHQVLIALMSEVRSLQGIQFLMSFLERIYNPLLSLLYKFKV